jgi:hypothetical protein
MIRINIESNEARCAFFASSQYLISMQLDVQLLDHAMKDREYQKAESQWYAGRLYPLPYAAKDAYFKTALTELQVQNCYVTCCSHLCAICTLKEQERGKKRENSLS